jgi:hypothetical protein
VSDHPDPTPHIEHVWSQPIAKDRGTKYRYCLIRWCPVTEDIDVRRVG